jgi:ribosome-associated protein
MNSEQHSSLVINALQEVKAQKIIKLDVRNITTVTDFMIVASGTSTRHIKALADKVSKKSREAGYRPIGIEGQEGSEWVLIDLDAILVHLMLPQVRDFYNLEKLWSLEPISEILDN